MTSAQMIWSRGNRPSSLARTSLAPSRPWMLAACATTAKSSPVVSTTIWRLLRIPPCLRHSRKAPFPRGSYRLAVDDRCAGTGPADLGLTGLGSQGVMLPLPGSVPAPSTEVMEGSTPGWQVVRHHSPGYPATQHVQDAVNHLPQIRSPGMSPGCTRGRQGFQQAPLGISQIGGIRSSVHTPKLTKTHRTRQATLMQVHTPF